MTIPDFLNTTTPLFSLRVRGEWQKSKIFQVIRGKQIIRNYTAYDGSAKIHVIRFQSKFAAAVWNWQNMPYAERRFYIARAAKLGLQISGYNYFISLYMRDKLEDYMAYPDPHHLSHEKHGADEINVDDLSGLLADEQNAGAIKGVLVDDSDIEDLKVLAYDSESNKFVFVEMAGGGEHTLIAKTANYNMTAEDLEGLTTFTNTGAAGAINLSLLGCVANYRVAFIVTVAQYLRVTANGTDKWRYGTEQGAAGGFVRSNVIGTAWMATCSGVGDWVISPLSGVLKYDE